MEILESSITVALQALAHGGTAIGPITEGPAELVGKKAFIPYTIPGEKVTAQITKSNSSFVEASLLQILEPHSSRISPKCKYYGQCGGCQLQHIELSAQRNFKLEMVNSALRVKKIFSKNPTILLGSDLPGLNYRKRINLHVNESGAIGFFKSSSSEVVEISECIISAQSINECLARIAPLKEFISGKIAGITIEEHKEKVFVIFHTGYDFRLDDLTSLVGKFEDTKLSFELHQNDRLLYSNIEEATSTDSASYELGHFTQVNQYVNSILVEQVRKLVQPGKVDDLYAGSGNLSFPLAQSGFTVRAIELDRRLVEVGQERIASSSDKLNLKFIQSSVEKFLQKNTLSSQVVLDPPRSGAKEFCKFVDSQVTKNIVYVSCNLPSLVRDSSTLLAKGYELIDLYVLDMFPQTYHVEMVARFGN